MRRAALASMSSLCLGLAAPAVVAAQDDFSRINAKLGQPMIVKENGALPHAGLKIQKRGDALWNGAILGALIGNGMGAAACDDRDPGGCRLSGAAVYAGIGALIDYAHKGKTTVYNTTPPKSTARVTRSIVPVFSARERAMLVSMRF